ncbi:MAG: hypothetical protein ACFFG0_04015 [Candidatus Thorarchaeota archaeon]
MTKELIENLTGCSDEICYFKNHLVEGTKFVCRGDKRKCPCILCLIKSMCIKPCENYLSFYWSEE